MVRTTIGWYIDNGYRLVASCQTPTCERVRLDGDVPNIAEVDLTAFDRAATGDEIKARLKCRYCGQRRFKAEFVGPPEPARTMR